MSDLMAAFNEAAAAEDTGTAGTGEASTPTPGPTPSPAAATAVDTTKATAPAAAAEPLIPDLNLDDLSPEHRAAVQAKYDALNKAWTTKTQDLAEQRRQIEARAQSLAAFEQLSQLAQERPEEAAAYFRQIADQLTPAERRAMQAASEAQNPLDPDLMTTTERALYDELQALKEQNRTHQQFTQTYQRELAERQIEQRFSDIEQSFGTKLDADTKQQLIVEAVRQGTDNLRHVYMDLHWDRIVQDRIDRALKEQAVKPVQAPTHGATGGTGTGSPASGKLGKDASLEDMFHALAAEAGMA